MKQKIIGCGYCAFETICEKHDPKVNKAKLGCEDYLHYEDAPSYDTKQQNVFEWKDDGNRNQKPLDDLKKVFERL